MGKWISKFYTNSEYQKFVNKGNFGLPHVSLTEDDGKVHYLSTSAPPSQPSDPYMGHEYVEIAGLKWATMNIGANSVTDYGLYFAWGETQGYTASQVGVDKDFSWGDYKFGNWNTINKYQVDDGDDECSWYDQGGDFIGDNKTTLDLTDDAARVNWGGSWRMPTAEEFTALLAAVNTEWTADYQDSGIAGLVCTDKTDSSKVLFFPAAGYCDEGEVNVVGEEGYYQSSSLLIGDSTAGRILFFDYMSIVQDHQTRYLGLSVRPVVG